jgi:protein-disulfide isomerase
MKLNLGRGLDMVMPLCAVAMVGMVGYRTFLAPIRTPAAPETRSAKEIPDWVKYAKPGHRIGSEEAKVVIIEFADFECPACRSFEVSALAGVRAKYPDDVAIYYRHWPLSYHRFAYPAARAAECAAAAGRFTEMHDVLYRKQDSLGLKAFSSFAKEAGVTDIEEFDECNGVSTPVDRIEADIVAVGELGGQGTPTVIVAGRMLVSGFDSTAFLKLVEKELSNSGQK